jgi:hypothetical protein
MPPENLLIEDERAEVVRLLRATIAADPCPVTGQALPRRLRALVLSGQQPGQ